MCLEYDAAEQCWGVPAGRCYDVALSSAWCRVDCVGDSSSCSCVMLIPQTVTTGQLVYHFQLQHTVIGAAAAAAAERCDAAAVKVSGAGRARSGARLRGGDVL